LRVILSVTVQIVDDWHLQKPRESEANIIIINTHDEILPVPDGYTKREWIAKIADFLTNRWGTWTHIGGYSFYHVHYQDVLRNMFTGALRLS